jgi:hypothetical protein
MKLPFSIFLAPVLIACTLFSGCTSSAETMEGGETESESDHINSASASKPIVHYNIIIAPDLSNRLLRPKPVNDGQVVKTVLKNIYPKILKHGKSVNQYDVFSASIISNKLINQYNIKTQDLQIDFSRFELRQMERIQYITGQAADNNLEKDKKKFFQEFTRVANAAAKSTSGADLWTYFNSGIGTTLVRDKGPESSFNKVTYKSQYRNIMILLTDGYIEAAMFGKKACPSGNKCYYLSGQKVKEFRAAFKRSGMNDMKAFFEKNNYGIIPAQNENLKKLEVLVLQMEDRSLNNAGNATVYPTDMDIMKLFWSDWLSKSEVKKFELRPVLASEAETEKVILNFLDL